MAPTGPVRTNAERQKAFRDRKRNGVKVVTGIVTPDGVTTVAPVTRVTQELTPSLGWHGEVKRLRGLVRDLEAEVAHLKRELAGRAITMIPSGSQFGTPMPSLACLHGGIVGACRKLGCRST